MNMTSTPTIASSFVHGQVVDAGNDLLDFTPAGGGTPFRIAEGGAAHAELAVQSAWQAFQADRCPPLVDRMDRLGLLADTLRAEAATLADLICEDVGKPIRIARGEVARGVQFVEACQGATAHLGGEVVPLDAVRGGAGRLGYTKRFPFGVVGAITPFNAPVNLLLQKLAPAWAAGNAVVAKPAPASTRVAVHLAQALSKQGLAPGLFNVLTGDRAAAQALAAHPQVGVVSFTGGTVAGEALVRLTGIRKFVSELGSNAANIVLADADLEDAARKIAGAAFEASGQQCISAQRVIIEKPVYERFVGLLVEAAKALRVGSVRDETTDIGPMVSAASADRVWAMCADAADKGARHLLEHRRDGQTVHPVILADVPQHARLWQEEVFGPVAVVIAADDASHALALANDSPFGLQGAVFTRDLRQALRFAEEFDVGAMWVNEASRFRLDMYPFGGMKQSGVGREGVRYAIEELTQIKFTGIHWR